MTPLPLMACRTCKRVLARWTAPTGERWVHNEELRGERVDHQAEPAPLSEVPDAHRECDFCKAPDPIYGYPTDVVRVTPNVVTEQTVGLADYQARHRAARVLSRRTERGVTQDLGGEWAACQPCADLIDARDLLALVRRVSEALPAKLTRGQRLVETRARLFDMYGRLFDSLGARTDIRPSTQDTEGGE